MAETLVGVVKTECPPDKPKIKKNKIFFKQYMYDLFGII